MTDTAPAPSAAQKIYVFLLRSMGWLGLLFVPILAFAWATGTLRPDVPVLMVALMAAPGLLISLYLSGAADRPTYLLRPTSFLKGFFVVGFIIGLASTAIGLQVLAFVIPIDTGALFALLGFPGLDHSIDRLLGSFYGSSDLAFLRAKVGWDFTVALFLIYPGAFAANFAVLFAWFIRFPKTIDPPMAERIIAQRPVYDEEKGRAIRAMRQRLMTQSAARRTN